MSGSTWWEEQDAWGVITPGLGANHYRAIHLCRNKLMVATRVTSYPISIWRMTISILSSPI